MKNENSIELVSNTSNKNEIIPNKFKHNKASNEDTRDPNSFELDKYHNESEGNYSKLLDNNHVNKNNCILKKNIGKTYCLLFINKSKPLIVIGPDCK